MSDAAPARTFGWRLRQRWDRVAVYLPIILMGLMALITYWLVRNTPSLLDSELESAPRHVPDYFMRDFSVKVFAANGELKSEMVGSEGRHYPDTDTLEIDQPRIRTIARDGRVTTAQAAKGIINADGSEIQLFDHAVLVRDSSTTASGMRLPRSELRSDFLHLFANAEKIRTHRPVELVRGATEHFSAQGMEYDNLERVMHLNGRVRGTLAPRP